VLPLLGTLFCLWYIKEATCDIVYSDYIRLVGKYLPDVWKAENFFRADVLTRIPINYPVRAFNVAFFKYSTTFDMALGALGLGLSALVLGHWCDKKQVGMGWFTFLMFLLFGLNKWEMLTNGSGWAHFLAFACFYYHYLVFDRVLYGQGKKHDKALLLALPPVITLAIAGPYCAVYSVVMILAYGGVWTVNRYLAGRESRRAGSTAGTAGNHAGSAAGAAGRPLPMDGRFCLAGIISVLIPLLLYIWSNSYATEEHDGAITIGLMEMLVENPMFFPAFLMKSLASMVMGQETIQYLAGLGLMPEAVVYLLGAAVAGGYLLALYMNARFRVYERTVLPLMLLVAGMGNHAIILVSRYIFGRESYGMSSRYALQYQVGILGIVLTFALVWRTLECMYCRVLAAALCALLLAGQGYTDWQELEKAPYREEYGENIARAALQYEVLSDDELRTTFDYREGREESADDVRYALRILKENGWNVFRGQ